MSTTSDMEQKRNGDSSPTKQESMMLNTTATHASDQEAIAIPKNSPGARNYVVPDGIDEKKLNLKIDLQLVPWLSVLYLASFLDRSAIGNARLFGLENDLHMDKGGTQFAIATAIFFIPYALFEVPSNILLKRLRPSVWFPLLTCLVGVCMMSQGLVRTYPQLVGARFCLGMTEAGLFPGVNAVLGGWYPRRMFGLRAAIFFSAATISGAFGGLLSAAIQNMSGIGRLYGEEMHGWRWIFIIIGLATFVVGILSIWLVHDFPETAKFLTEPERKLVIDRLIADQKFSAAGEGFQWSQLFKASLDWKTWIGALCYMGVDGPLYAFSVFTPTIVQALGYKPVPANLISVPIYVFACIVTVAVGFIADRKGNRAMINMIMISIGIVGYIILAASRLPGLSYFAIYLAAAGIYPCVPNTIALTSTGIEGAYKRSIVMAIIISWGNINGAATTNVYRSKDKPWYTLGHGMIILYLVIGFATSFIYWMGLRRANERRAKGLADETILSESDTNSGESGGVLEQKAAEARQQIAQDNLAKHGALRARIMNMYARFGESDGGVFATRDEAQAVKGDAYSRFVYSY